jgi:DUF4097 and DUF4098 domain-containing protein YvlB
MKNWLAVAVVAAAPGLATAQDRLDERRPAAPDGIVQIENASGSIRVTGWDKPEVAVAGHLGRGAEALDFGGTPRRTRIEVEVHGNPHGVRSDLEVRVPAGCRLEIESFNASITVTDVTGTVTAESVQGTISIAGKPKEVVASSVNGAVEVTGAAARVNAESVNGHVTVKGATGEVDASTVNGTLSVSGGTFERARLETVSGSIEFDGDLADGATLDASTVSGSVDLLLPAQVSAAFSVTTFSGDIVNELGPAPRKVSRYTSQKELTFSAGSGNATVSIETLSGEINLRKR